jgi:hypothetical protein
LGSYIVFHLAPPSFHFFGSIQRQGEEFVMKTVSVFGAMFLIAVLSFSTGSAQASQSALQDEDRGTIHGWAFNDLDKDGIQESGEFGLAGTVICLVGHNWCDHTEWGEYMFDWLVPGNYQVELTQWPDGYFVLSPNPITVTVPEGGVVIEVDFALSNDAAGVIRGMAFVDTDRDGVRDPLEPGLDGVQVCLVGHNWCNYTEYGEYEFDLLPPDEYTIRLQEFPKSYHPTSPRKIHVTLADGQIRSDIDFGFRRDQRRIK